MHERIIDHINKHEGVHWATFDQIATDFIRRNPQPG
jgi:peptidoglycan-N-acetylglucosamine deacetylase